VTEDGGFFLDILSPKLASPKGKPVRLTGKDPLSEGGRVNDRRLTLGKPSCDIGRTLRIRNLEETVSGKLLPLLLQEGTSPPRQAAVTVEHAVIAGWTGRDASAVEKHIKELEVLGVKRPATTPIFYRVAAARLTTASSIEVLGAQSSGEVEFVLLQAHGALWIGTGSDHTDREVEAYGVSVSKQMCEKPIASTFWRFDDVVAHWDQLILRSRAIIDDVRVLYQEGLVSAMRHPEDLIARFSPSGLPEETMMFCGTLAVHGGVRPAQAFEFELEDPIRQRKIHHRYDIVSLPNLG
jgi:hypothetical protein